MRRVVLVAVGMLAVLFGLQQLALGDLRRLESAYIEAREPTACATAALKPMAFSPDQSKMPETVLRLVTEASEESLRVERRFRRRDHVRLPIPALRQSERAIGEALVAQVSLYDAMVHEPAASEPKLRTLGLANTAAERRLARARRMLLASETTDWKRRFVCDDGR